jgi:hypothetical protein
MQAGMTVIDATRGTGAAPVCDLPAVRTAAAFLGAVLNRRWADCLKSYALHCTSQDTRHW